MFDDKVVLVLLDRQIAVDQTKCGVVRNFAFRKRSIDSRLPVGFTHFPYVVRNAAEEPFYRSSPSFRQRSPDRPRKKIGRDRQTVSIRSLGCDCPDGRCGELRRRFNQ